MQAQLQSFPTGDSVDKNVELAVGNLLAASPVKVKNALISNRSGKILAREINVETHE